MKHSFSRFPLHPRILVLVLILLAASLLSGCVGGTAVSTSWPGITVVDESIYLAHGTQVFALRATDGSLIWQFPEKADTQIAFYAAPVLTPDGQLIVGSYGPGKHELYSLNPVNGQVNWTFSGAKDNYVASPLVTEKGIFAPNADGNLYALDFKGKTLWAPFSVNKPLWATPATNDACDCIFLPAMDHVLYAVSAESGQQLWKTEDMGGALVASPTFADGKLYVGAFANKLVALDATNGKILWQKDTEAWVWSGVATDGDILYFGDLAGNFYALKAEDGAEVWRGKSEGAIAGTPLIVGDQIYFTSDTDSVFGFTKDGAALPKIKLSGRLIAPIAQAGDLLLVAPNNTKEFLIAITPSGEQKWTYPVVEK